MFRKNHDDHWIPLADLMTGLMIIFLLIAVILIGQMRQQISHNKHQLVSVKKVDSQPSLRFALYRELDNQFKNDLPKWHASIDEKNLSIQFLGPEVLFETGSAKLRPEFKQILADFFPRYLKIITQAKYLTSLRNIRIEGYSSSFWHGVSDVNQAYFLNMQLSESRALETFRYLNTLDATGNVFNNMSLQSYQQFLRNYVIVSGLSSSHPVKSKEGLDDNELSQRVEFKVGI